MEIEEGEERGAGEAAADCAVAVTQRGGEGGGGVGC